MPFSVFDGRRDVCSLPLPPTATCSQLIDAVRSLAQRSGQRINSFVACTAAGSLTSSVQQQLRLAGVHVCECIGSKQSPSCDVFVVTRMLAIVLSAASCTEGSPCSQSSLLLLSDDRDLLPALALLRRSGHFEQVLLVHSNSQAADHVTPAISLTQLLHCYRAAPSVCTSQLTDCGDAAEAHCQSAVHRSSHRGSIPGGITPPSSDIASAATTPSSVSVASCRSLYASTASALPCQPSASPSRSSECVQAFTAIVQCCEREKIIPRESVLRKKLLDSHSALCVEFEQFLSCVVDSGVGVVEGCSPQRVLWPREGQTARRFAW